MTQFGVASKSLVRQRSAVKCKKAWLLCVRVAPGHYSFRSRQFKMKTPRQTDEGLPNMGSIPSVVIQQRVNLAYRNKAKRLGPDIIGQHTLTHKKNSGSARQQPGARTAWLRGNGGSGSPWLLNRFFVLA